MQTITKHKPKGVKAPTANFRTDVVGFIPAPGTITVKTTMETLVADAYLSKKPSFITYSADADNTSEFAYSETMRRLRKNIWVYKHGAIQSYEALDVLGRKGTGGDVGRVLTHIDKWQPINRRQIRDSANILTRDGLRTPYVPFFITGGGVNSVVGLDAYTALTDYWDAGTDFFALAFVPYSSYPVHFENFKTVMSLFLSGNLQAKEIWVHDLRESQVPSQIVPKAVGILIASVFDAKQELNPGGDTDCFSL
jgi:hypothetical protein